MSSNIIGPSPKRSVAPSDKVDKASGELDDIEAPVVTICQNYLDNKKERTMPRNTTYIGSLQYKSSGLVLIMSGQKKKIVYVNRISIIFVYKMNIEGQDIETYKIFVDLMDNEEIA